MHIQVDKVQRIKGFTVCNVPKDHYFWALSSASLTSDEPSFYRYIEEISNIYLHSIRCLFDGEEYPINIDEIHQFLILIHRDLSADIYVNDFSIEVKMLAKRDLKARLIRENDIADISELRFPDIDIQESDSIIYCFKVGWKFGLYFNLLSGEDRCEDRVDIALMQVKLGRLYRYLRFQYVYQSLESENHFGEMIKDGWFPFVQILGEEYKELARTYQNKKFNYDDKIKKMLDKFNESRVKGMTEKWWKKPIFREKQQLLQAGIDAFLQGNESGYINCIKTLYTEIEGIMRFLYRNTGQGNRVGLKELILHLTDIGKQRAANDDQSLLLARQFLEYLTGSVFTNFDLGTGTVDLSRHSASHGVAIAKDYTPERALQALLTLDQIYFYLPESPNETGNANTLAGVNVDKPINP